METVRTSVVAREMGEGQRGGVKCSQGSETTFHDIVREETCHYTFVETQRIYNPRVNPHVNHGF